MFQQYVERGFGRRTSSLWWALECTRLSRVSDLSAPVHALQIKIFRASLVMTVWAEHRPRRCAARTSPDLATPRRPSTPPLQPRSDASDAGSDIFLCSVLVFCPRHGSAARPLCHSMSRLRTPTPPPTSLRFGVERWSSEPNGRSDEPAGVTADTRHRAKPSPPNGPSRSRTVAHCARAAGRSDFEPSFPAAQNGGGAV